jgi:hypothetical protein
MDEKQFSASGIAAFLVGLERQGLQENTAVRTRMRRIRTAR